MTAHCLVLASLVSILAVSPGGASAYPEGRQGADARVDPAAVAAVVDLTVQRMVLDIPPFLLRWLQEPRRKYVCVSRGAGVIVRPDGYIVTNAHIVSRPHDRLVVGLADGRRRIGDVVGFDWASDIALVHIVESNLPSMTFTHAERPTVGQPVVAIGSPLGQPWQVTPGVVSGLGWSTRTAGERELAWVLSNAATLPGASGGPLLARNGQPLGINTLITSESPRLGVAIPAERVARSVENLIGLDQRTYAPASGPSIPLSSTRDWIVEGRPLSLSPGRPD